MPSLADLLTIESSASTFYSYARELSLSELFSRQLQAGFTGTEGQGQGLTLLVPTNKAVMALERKPHQGPPPSDTVISEEEFDKSSKDNVQRWVEAHVIPVSSISLVLVSHAVVSSFKRSSLTLLTLLMFYHRHSKSLPFLGVFIYLSCALYTVY
ncbi:hypothetical protein BT96DRAFT_830276 [Gymnopus androsaceus JB14]|uniref:FAS1 domain-containing protein n=1 Tax=Gymnopus androsaceus JB14 TaxID=1447944 RepID=A0A6A4H3E4_9AGAR|nr:hypothetical protein BT96DRAFT_830276 [Gymnopus androsaceus JB14]